MDDFTEAAVDGETDVYLAACDGQDTDCDGNEDSPNLPVDFGGTDVTQADLLSAFAASEEDHYYAIVGKAVPEVTGETVIVAYFGSETSDGTESPESLVGPDGENAMFTPEQVGTFNQRMLMSYTPDPTKYNGAGE